jgi:perosamine synthetase
MSKIPLSVPSLKGNEWKYIKECLDTEWVSSAGKYVDLFEQRMAEYTGVKQAIACVNGTAALQLSLRLAGVERGDEVIVPTLTFIAPINSIIYNGASPVFIDADEFYNMDSEKTISFIKEHTIFKDGFTYNKVSGKRIRAIVPVHIWGNAVWLDDLVEICNERNIAIVEDASESLGTRYIKGKFHGRHTGTIGILGCISFNGNKIITSGGGGMILTDDEQLAERARYLSTQAKDDPVRYIHNEVGYNFRLTNIQAALGLAQLEQLPGFLTKKRAIYKQYAKGLNGRNGYKMAEAPDYSENNHWLNVLQLDTSKIEGGYEVIMELLTSRNIQTRPVWGLNHMQLPFNKFQSVGIKSATELVKSSLCLPSSVNIEVIDIDHIITLLDEWNNK